MLWRTLGGAAAGGLIGGMSGGDFGSTLKGAGLGAFTMGAGIGAGRMAGKGLRKLGGGSSLAGGMMRGMTAGASGLASAGIGAMGLMGKYKMGAGAARMTGRGVQAGVRGMSAASSYIGRNAQTVNKWGGRALGGLGMASAYSIGNSVLGSNRGY